MKTLRCAKCDEDIEVPDDDPMLTTPGEHAGCGGRLYVVMMIRCGEHGAVEWRGDVVCAACKQIYLCEGITVDEAGKMRRLYPNAPDKGLCKCGKRLFGGSDFTMRPTCRECAVRVLQAN